MRLLADHCLYGRTIRVLREAAHAVVSLKEIGSQAADDDEVLRIARSGDLVLITTDLDFGNILRYPPETHAGIVVLRADPRESLAAVEALLLDLLRSIDRDALRGSLVVVSPTGWRIRR